MKLYSKDQRSTFGYWFAHWCAFQIVALLTGLWKPRYLLHDIEKPWLRLFMDYPGVQRWHRKHNNHHLEYLVSHDPGKFDFKAFLIDLECGRYTKEASPYSAKEYIESEREKLLKLCEGNERRYEYREFIREVYPLLEEYFN